jgi:hypothetical protein
MPVEDDDIQQDDLSFDVDPDDIDSVCYENPILADAPVDNICGNEAVTYIFRPAGNRSYICRDHAEEATRFGDDVFDGDGKPTLVSCKRCLRPTPRNRVSVDKICEECER